MATHEETVQMVAQAEKHMDSTDRMVRAFVGMVAGKLRAYDVDSGDLKALKNELQDFDATRKRWKPRKGQD